MMHATIAATEEHVYLFDQNRRLCYANPLAVTELGGSLAACLGLPLEVLDLPVAWRSVIAAGVDDVITGNTNGKGKTLPGKGVGFTSTFAPVTGPEGLVLGVVACVGDTRAQHHVQQALEDDTALTRRLARAVERTINGIMATDTRGRIEWVNDGFTRITGYTLDEVRGHTPGSLLQGKASDPETIAFMGEQVRKVERFKAEIINYRKSGEPYWVRIDAEPLYDENGAFTGFMGVETEITEQKQREQELRVAKEQAEEINRLKSIVLSNLSHEIRTPLTSILGFGELLQEEARAEMQEYVASIMDNAERLMETLKALLDLAQLETGAVELRPRATDLAALAAEVLASYESKARKRGLWTMFRPPPSGEANLSIDDYLIRQVLEKVVDNAVKFTVTGGVSVAVACLEEGVEVVVSDTGIGIEETYLNRIFDVFTQASFGHARSHEGNGLGLHVAQRLLDVLQGKITITSHPGAGTKVRIVLPAAPIQQIAPPMADDIPAALPANGRLRLLIIEDQPDIRMYLDVILKSAYDVDLVDNAEDALREAEAKRYDLFLVDINLKDERNGIDLFHALRAMPDYEHAPIVACTAYALPSERAYFLETGFDEYVPKPFKRKTLMDALERMAFLIQA